VFLCKYFLDFLFTAFLPFYCCYSGMIFNAYYFSKILPYLTNTICLAIQLSFVLPETSNQDYENFSSVDNNSINSLKYEANLYVYTKKWLWEIKSL